jgi:Methyltransferase TRM13
MRRTAAQPFFCADINLPIPHVPLAMLPVDTALAVAFATKLHAELPPDIWYMSPSVALPPETEAIRTRVSNARDSTVRYFEKHFNQAAALTALLDEGRAIGHDAAAESNRIMKTSIAPSVGVVEMGAGTAYTSMFAAEMLRMRNVSQHVAVVDRQGVRASADRTLRSFEQTPSAEGANTTFQRIRCDLKDLELGGLSELKACTKVWFIGKHVCGAALDMALVAIDRYARGQTTTPVQVALASCCRHMCSWEAAPAASTVWRGNWGCGRDEMAAVCKMCGWFTAGHEDEELKAKGRLCQEIVDAGRVMWLRSLGWQAHLVRYVDDMTSPESLAIVASWTPVPEQAGQKSV